MDLAIELNILSSAATLARRIKRPLSRGFALLRIAAAYATKGCPDECARLIDEVKIEAKRLTKSDTLLLDIRIGFCLTLCGRIGSAQAVFSQVLETLKESRDPIEGHSAAFTLAEVYCELRWEEKLWAALEEMKYGGSDPILLDIYRDTMWSAISRSRVQAGQLASALDAAEHIENGSAKALELADLLLRCVDRSDLSESELHQLKRICRPQADNG